MKRVLLICPAMPDDMPYMKPYLEYLDSSNIEYDVTYVRNKTEQNKYPSNYFAYETTTISNNFVRKTFRYCQYSRFVRNQLSKVRYTHIITMGIACSVFLCNDLKKNFKGKYIYDIRDYSQILRLPIFRHANNQLLSHSFMNVISSGGFKKWLPTSVEYILCHNTTQEKIKEVENIVSDIRSSKPIMILTIGQIRDLDANTYVIEKLSNNGSFELVFAGKGKTIESLEKMVDERGYTNVIFSGRYKKEEEDIIVKQTNLINVCMGSNMVSDYLLSNRLYLAARLKKPLISFSDCYQADVIKKYNLGVVINRKDNFLEKVQDYISLFNPVKFTQGCSNFLNEVQYDLNTFSQQLESFFK